MLLCHPLPFPDLVPGCLALLPGHLLDVAQRHHLQVPLVLLALPILELLLTLAVPDTTALQIQGGRARRPCR